MAKRIKKIIKVVIIFLIIWIGGSAISMGLDINNGLLPSFFLGAAIAIWLYKSK
ncbi:hypothetical protein KKC00_00250 [Patescibacteria group bacterium]|nr:hypothetical protein [Patescibacteria group bacterium]